MNNNVIQEIMRKYQEDPEEAQRYVENHEWSKTDIKLVKKARKRYRWLLPREARDMIDSIIETQENKE